MFLALNITRVARRTLDALLVLVIVVVLAILVLARGVPWLTGGTTLVVGGRSMEPSIPVGSVVLAAPVESTDLRPGDVVSLRVGPQHAVFTHRIVRLVELPGGLHLETRGDANENPDPSLVPASAVIGRVSFSLPIAGYAMSALGTPSGAMLMLSVSLMLLAGAWLLEGIEHDQRRALRARAARALERWRARMRTADGASGSGPA